MKFDAITYITIFTPCVVKISRTVPLDTVLFQFHENPILPIGCE